jgi:hypothetical protein
MRCGRPAKASSPAPLSTLQRPAEACTPTSVSMLRRPAIASTSYTDLGAPGDRPKPVPLHQCRLASLRVIRAALYLMMHTCARRRGRVQMQDCSSPTPLPSQGHEDGRSPGGPLRSTSGQAGQALRLRSGRAGLASVAKARGLAVRCSLSGCQRLLVGRKLVHVL